MIHSMMLVRNEANRWIREALEQHKQFADRIVIIDDNSSDNTADICRQYTKNVHVNDKRLWNNNESLARRNLWENTIAGANYGDVIICLDADELIDEEQLRHMKQTLNYFKDYDTATSLGFTLYDMWNNEEYREDIYWTAHKRLWRFAVKYDRNTIYKFSHNRLHCERLPIFERDSMLASRIKIKHMGWSKEEDRINKYARYMRIDGDGEHGILEQYKSILDKSPKLRRYVSY